MEKACGGGSGARFIASPSALFGLALLLLGLIFDCDGGTMDRCRKIPMTSAQLDIMDGMLPPGSQNRRPASRHGWALTNRDAICFLSAMIYGTRISLIVGASSVDDRLPSSAHRWA